MDGDFSKEREVGAGMTGPVPANAPDFYGDDISRAPQLVFFSRDRNEILPALVRVQGSLISPRRNREVEVYSKRTNSKYKFRYTTANVLNDLIREPLLLAGCFIIHQIVEAERKKPSDPAIRLYTTLWHTSGQWAAIWWPVWGDDTQDVAVGVTYAKRYAICCLLNIASGDEDEQGNRYSGKQIVGSADLSVAERYENEAQRERADFKAIVQLARAANDIQSLTVLLEAWKEKLHVYAPWRENPDRRAAYDMIVSDISSKIGAHLHPHIAEAWVRAAMSRTPADAESVRAEINGRWEAEISRLRAKLPRHYQYWADHVRFFLQRAEEAPTDGADLEDLGQFLDTNFKPPRPPEKQPSLWEPASPGDGSAWPRLPTTAEQEATAARTEEESRQEIENLIGAVENGTAPEGPEPEFSHQVRDETGALLTDPITDPMTWAEIYGNAWAEASNLTEMRRQNAAALEAIEEYPAAKIIIEVAMEQSGETSAEPGLGETFKLPALEWPKNRAGTGIDIAKAVKLLEFELGQLGNDAQMAVWLESNAEPLVDKSLPPTTMLRMKQMVMARRQQLAGS